MGKEKHVTACPMMNILINTGLINEENASDDDVRAAINKISLVDKVVLHTFMNLALHLVKDSNLGNDIKRINKHNLLEHDASLTRLDAYFGNEIVLNKKRYNKLKDMSEDGKYLTVKNFSDHKNKMIIHSKKNNPEFVFGFSEVIKSLVESSLVYTCLRDQTGNVPIERMDTFIKRARFPSAKGKLTINQIKWHSLLSIMFQLATN